MYKKTQILNKNWKKRAIFWVFITINLLYCKLHFSFIVNYSKCNCYTVQADTWGSKTCTSSCPGLVIQCFTSQILRSLKETVKFMIPLSPPIQTILSISRDMFSSPFRTVSMASSSDSFGCSFQISQVLLRIPPLFRF